VPNPPATGGIQAINPINTGGKINPAVCQARTGFDVAVGREVPQFDPGGRIQAIKATNEISVQAFTKEKPAIPKARRRIGVQHGAAVIEFPEATAGGTIKTVNRSPGGQTVVAD
jgi:hypothetical protein